MTGKRKWIRWMIVPAFVLTLTAAGTGIAYGAAGIEAARTDCGIRFTLEAGELNAGDQANLEHMSPDYREYYRELGDILESGGSVEVKLYRIAEVDETCRFSLLGDYDCPALEGLEQADDKTTAMEWAQWADAAAGILTGVSAEGVNGDGGEAGSGNAGEEPGGRAGAYPLPEPDGAGLIVTGENGKAQGAVSGLSTGMYLVWVEPVETEDYLYRFIPFLVSLPSLDSGEVWNYGEDAEKPVIVGLKPEREDLYGDLSIEKNLLSYNETLAGASFVFEIKAVKEDRLVYSDVVSMTFDGPGSGSLTVEDIPAGARVTVTEIYSGAGYRESTGTASRSTVIEAGDTAAVSFTNEYDGRLNGGGTSIINHFVYEKDEDGSESLDWEKLYGEIGSAR